MFESVIRLFSEESEDIPESTDDIIEIKAGHWSNYLEGAARVYGAAFGVKHSLSLDPTSLDFPSASGIVSVVYPGYIELFDRISELESLVEKLRKEVKSLTKNIDNQSSITSMQLFELQNEKFSIIKPIQLIVEFSDDEVIASWPDTRVFGRGDTLTELLIDIRNNIVQEYLDIKSRDMNSLGEIAIYTLDMFDTYIQETQ